VKVRVLSSAPDFARLSAERASSRQANTRSLSRRARSREVLRHPSPSLKPLPKTSGPGRPAGALLLDAPLDVGRERIATRKLDHFEREQQPFFERVRGGYLERAAQNPERIKIVDAAAMLADVQRAIAAELDALIGRLRR